MFLSYTGQKEGLELTRPELKEKYNFKGNYPVEVENSDGNYILKEFGGSFKEVAAPVVKEPKKPTKAEQKKG